MTDVTSNVDSAKRRRWRPRKRTILILAGLFLLAFVGLNFVAYMQARAMMHFVQLGERTAPPESLGLIQKIEVLFTGVRIPRPMNVDTPAAMHLDFQTFRFGGNHGDDCEAWFVPCEHPKGLCLQFHGYASCKSSLLDAALEFHNLNYDVLMTDFRGSGGSVGDNTTIGYHEADDVASACAFASKQWPGKPIVLYGQSMGGVAILRAVADLGVFPSAVIIESTFDRLLSTAENRFHVMGIPAFPAAELLVYWGGRQIGCNGFNLNPADYAERVHCPVLEIQGGNDPRVTNAQARNLFDHLAGPKQWQIFANSGHCTFIADDPVRWVSVVTAFLRKPRIVEIRE
jgi:uncharacterized protein